MLIGVRDDCVTGAGTLEKMTALKEIGYDFLELVLNPELLGELTGSGEGDRYAPKKALKDLNLMVAETGLPVLSVSHGFMYGYASKDEAARAASKRELRQSVELASALGANTILLACCEPEANLRDAALLYKAELRDEMDFAFSRGIKLCLEPVARGNKNAYIVMLARMIDHPAVYTYFDMGNCLFFGEDPIAELHDCVDNVGALHIKPGRDMSLGEMPLTGILNALNGADFDGVGVIEMKSDEGNKLLAETLALLDKLGYRG